MENIIEEYLVKLGIQIDNKALGKAKETLNGLSKSLASKLPASAQAAIKGISPFAQALIAVNVEVIKMVNQVAKADMQYQLLAQRMFLSVQAAKAFTLASETMGHNLQEIAWNAELREKYFDLVDQVNKLQLSSEHRDMLKQVRGVGHEFDRLKLAGKLSLEWLTVHILNLNKGGVSELKSQLRSITQTIFDKIPIWTKQLAEFLNIPIKLLGAAVKFGVALKDIIVPVLEMVWGWFVKVWDIMKPAEKQFVILAGLLIAVFSPVLGPIAAATAAITGILLLLDDFFGYLEGKKSSEFLAPFWELSLFLGHQLKKSFYTIMIAAEHFWDAIRGKKHASGKDFIQDIADTMADIDKEFEEGQQKRFDAIAKHEAEARARQAAEKPYYDEYNKKWLAAKPEDRKKLEEEYFKGKAARDAQPVMSGGAQQAEKLPAKVTSGEQELLKVIAKGEGTSDEQARKKGYASGYDVTLGYGAYGGKTEKPLTEMTLAEIEKHQEKMLADPKNKFNSSALGKYQFTKSTLFGSGKDVGEIARLGISKDTKFTPELQDKLALALIGKQTERFKRGDISQSQYQNVLAGQWASIAKAGTGVSAYGQRVGTTGADLSGALANLRGAPGVNIPPAAPPPGLPVYAKASEASQDAYNINVTVNAQTTDPKAIADEATKGVKKSIQELRKEKFNKVVRDRASA